MIQNFHIYFTQMKQSKKHNELIFLQNEGDVFMFHAQDRHHDICLQSFQLQNDANFIARLHQRFK